MHLNLLNSYYQLGLDLKNEQVIKKSLNVVDSFKINHRPTRVFGYDLTDISSRPPQCTGADLST